MSNRYCVDSVVRPRGVSKKKWKQARKEYCREMWWRTEKLRAPVRFGLSNGKTLTFIPNIDIQWDDDRRGTR